MGTDRSQPGIPDGENPGDSPHIYLQPIVAPTVLGLYAYAGSIVMIAPWLGGWYGDPATPHYLAPFVLVFGGIGQFSAALWAFRSRLLVITAISATWAMEHTAWALLMLLFAGGVLAEPRGAFSGLGIWYVTLAGVQWVGALVATRVSVAVLVALATGGLGATLLAVFDLFGLGFLAPAGAGVLIASGVAAWYTASATLLQASFGRPIWPLGMLRQPPPVAPGPGEPGVARRGL